MKLAIASDLHFEFYRDAGLHLVDRLPEADVLICAGDLATSTGLGAALDLLCRKYAHVVYVCGNHEFYGSSVLRVRKMLDRFPREELKYLQDSTCEIGGFRFVGSTLWFPELPGNGFYEPRMNDFHAIEHARETVYREHEATLKFLSETVSEGDIVVTHHLPSVRCVAPRFKRSALNRFFVGDVGNLLSDRKARLWVHGHTHDAVDFVVGETRVVCNPSGYPGEMHGGYRPNLTIEI